MAPMLGRLRRTLACVADLAGCERCVAQLHDRIAARAATDDAMGARTERRQIAAGVHETADAAREPQSIEGTIDRKAFGDAAEINAERYPHTRERRVGEIEIRQTPCGAG